MLRIISLMTFVALASAACSVGFSEGRHGGGGHVRLGSTLRPGVILANYDDGEYRHHHRRCWYEWRGHHQVQVCN